MADRLSGGGDKSLLLFAARLSVGTDAVILDVAWACRCV